MSAALPFPAANDSRMKINGIDAVYYSTKDFDRAQAFYNGIIGAAPQVAVPNAFCEWTLPNGESFGLIKGDHFRPGSGVLFNVDDVKASVAELQAQGVKLDDDGEIEETPVCFMAFASDTEGNAFILHQRK
jgi:predicted enzyme related to lactoylglutathione lyase